MPLRTPEGVESEKCRDTTSLAPEVEKKSLPKSPPLDGGIFGRMRTVAAGAGRKAYLKSLREKKITARASMTPE